MFKVILYGLAAIGGFSIVFTIGVLIYAYPMAAGWRSRLILLKTNVPDKINMSDDTSEMGDPEGSYRRGYQQGAAAALEAVNRLTIEKLEQ